MERRYGDVLSRFGGESERRLSRRRGRKKERRRLQRWPVTDRAVVIWADSRGIQREASARLIDGSSAGVGLIIPVPVPSDAKVAVLLDDGVEYRGVVRYCIGSGENYRLGLLWAQEASASPPVRPEPGRCLLKWVNPKGNLVTAASSSRCASAENVTVLCPQPVPVLSTVLVIAEAGSRFGIVQSCQPESGGYIITIRFHTANGPLLTQRS